MLKGIIMKILIKCIAASTILLSLSSCVIYDVGYSQPYHSYRTSCLPSYYDCPIIHYNHCY